MVKLIALVILSVGVLYMIDAHEMETCLETHSTDTCNYVLR